MLAAGPISGVAASFYILKYFFEKNNSSIFGIVSASVGLINNIINLLPHSTEVPGFGTVKNDGQQILENIQEIYTSFKNFVNQQ